MTVEPRFPFRVALPFSSSAGAVTDEYLDLLAASGYNALYVEFHPFRDYNVDPIPLPIGHILRLCDLVTGPDADRLVSYLKDVFARAADRGIEGWLYVMEPWGGERALVEDRPDVLGSSAVPHLTQPLCMDLPEVRDHLARLARAVVERLPLLRGLIVMSEDGATICDDTCPRSTGPRSARRAALFSALADGLRDSDVRLVAYTWWWDADDFDAVAGVLPPGSLLCTRTSTKAPYRLDGRWHGTPQDVSLLVDGPGQDWQSARTAADAHGLRVVDMLPVSNGHELLSLPEMPAPARYAAKLDTLATAGGAGWVAYDCGGVTEGVANEVLRRALVAAPGTSPEEIMGEVARSIFGADADRAVEGWSACTDALRHFPVELERTADRPNRHGGALCALAPLVPFTVRRAHLYDVFGEERDASPIAGIARGMWHEMWVDRDVLLEHFPPLLHGLERGAQLLRGAAGDRDLGSAAQAAADNAEAAARCIRSGLHLLQLWLALAGGGDPTSVLRRERENTLAWQQLVARDDRLFSTAATKQLRADYFAPQFQAAGLLGPDLTVAQVLTRKLELLDEELATSALAGSAT